MKITFPHMGNMYIAVKGMLEFLDLEVVVPPHSNQRTLNLGVKYAPEFACLPFKIGIGNLIEAYEVGADTVIMAGGVGPCRFGLYGHMENHILREIGYKYDLLVLEPPDKHLGQFFSRLKKIIGSKTWRQVFEAAKFGYQKSVAVDIIEKKLQYIRPREKKKGTADSLAKKIFHNINNATNFRDLKDATGLGLNKLEKVTLDLEKDIVKVGIIGEIYTVLEPFTNFDIEKKLGALGVEVSRSIYLSEWVNSHLLFGLDKNNQIKPFAKYAKPYLNYFVGGHGRETIGHAVGFSKEGYDGLIQLTPLTCMPEIIAHSILPRVREDLGTPILTLYVDEQTGQAGMQTRLEAFIDLIRRQKMLERRRNCEGLLRY